ncbi:MAG TPA: hypothetical protein VG106_08115, partial [Vicinamibacterales bacterium]|nr:hypothetical protein [Vicinamibacterales bacterium]
NFRGAPMPVDSLAAGMSVWGVHHLAGNVAEMLRNRLDDGFAATGGGFDDPTYQFAHVAAYPGFYSSSKLGFRCVRESATADQGAFALVTAREKPPRETPVGDAEFAKLRRVYDYERTPLNAKIVERVETEDWVREKVSYTGARGKTALAYVYLPKGVRPPYQVIHFAPAADVERGARTLPMSMETSMRGIVRGGRALFGVVLEGYRERETSNNAEGANELVDDIIDIRRGLDYLTSRPDIAASKIGFYNPSAGHRSFILTAVDSRYAALAFIGSNYAKSRAAAPEENRVNFIPRIKPPKIVVHGRYDEVNPFPIDGQALYDLMRDPKELLPFDGGHIPPNEWAMPRLIAWYDKILGPV